MIIQGPSDTPYEGGIFILELFLTKEYPMRPPKVRMLTPIWHPGIDKLGRICLDILKDKWTPALQISRVCLAIQLLLLNPEPIDDPIDSKVADIWKKDDEKEWNEKAKLRAREYTLKYAMN